MLYSIYGNFLIDEFRNWVFLLGVKSDREGITNWVLLFLIYLFVGWVYLIIRPKSHFL